MTKFFEVQPGSEMRYCTYLFFISSFTTMTFASTSFDANVKMVNFSQTDQQKVYKAIELIKRVVASGEFKERILGHTYKGKKTFVDNMGLSNEEIYQKIVDGSETLFPEKNGKMDVELELYQQSTNTIGYTYPHTQRIWINTKYFSKYSPVQIADNLFHEWVHKLGFDHELKYSRKRKYSVPYAIGYLVEELAAKHYKPE